MKFEESHRWGLNYMFKHMTAWDSMWGLFWEYALEESDNDVVKAMALLDEICTKREAVSINSALRKAGFSHRVVSING